MGKEGGLPMNHRTGVEPDSPDAQSTRKSRPAEARGIDQKIESRAGIDTGSFGPRLLDTRQVAALLHVSESWVRDHSQPDGPSPRLPAMKFGTGKTAVVRFHPSDVLAFIDEQRQNGRTRGTRYSGWRN
jgi:hypothetical protein